MKYFELKYGAGTRQWQIQFGTEIKINTYMTIKNFETAHDYAHEVILGWTS